MDELCNLERERQQVHLWFLSFAARLEARPIWPGEVGYNWAEPQAGSMAQKTEAHHHFLPPTWQPSGISRS
jgi:hypothetical protein